MSNLVKIKSKILMFWMKIKSIKYGKESQKQSFNGCMYIYYLVLSQTW